MEEEILGKVPEFISYRDPDEERSAASLESSQRPYVPNARQTDWFRTHSANQLPIDNQAGKTHDLERCCAGTQDGGRKCVEIVENHVLRHHVPIVFSNSGPLGPQKNRNRPSSRHGCLEGLFEVDSGHGRVEERGRLTSKVGACNIKRSKV